MILDEQGGLLMCLGSVLTLPTSMIIENSRKVLNAFVPGVH